MSSIYADFNARTADDRVRLDTVGSQQSVAEEGVGAGTWTWLTDGEIRAGAQLEDSVDGLVARVAWETVEHVPTTDELADSEQIARSFRELQSLMSRPERDHRRVLAVLPLAERRLPRGAGDYYRARVAQAFGYPELALVAMETALEQSPADARFVHQRLDLLKSVDLQRAFTEAKKLTSDTGTPAIVLAACASIYAAKARELSQSALEDVQRELLDFTDRFDRAPGRDTAPASVVTFVHVTRGFSLLHLGSRDKATEEFSAAIKLDPSSAEAYAARGLENYPSDESVHDLENATRLGSPSYWPAYYLAYHYLREQGWSQAEKYCETALLFDPPARVRANLLEWRAIARVQQGGDLRSARTELECALELAPDNERLRRNLQLLEQRSSNTPWCVERDLKGDSADVRLAA